jgi:hypothetical protein
MLSQSEPAIRHALSNVRYDVVDWLRHQIIHSKDYEEVLARVLVLCNANGLQLKSSDLQEPESKAYFTEHGFFHFVFCTAVAPEKIALISPAILKELRFIEDGKIVDKEEIGRRLRFEETARKLLLAGNKDNCCFLKAVLIPFGELRPKERPEAVYCVNACLTNLPDIWSLLYFPVNI